MLPTPIADRSILLLTHHARDPSEAAWLVSHFARVEDWESWERVARDNRVVPWVTRELERLGLLAEVPDAVRERCSDERKRILGDNQRRLERAVPVLAAMRARDIDVVVLKGAAFARTVYDDVGYKRMNDVDLLVRPEQVGQVERLYRELGLLRIADAVGDVDPERTHHLAPWVTRDLHCMLGTQWDFRSPLLGHDFELERVWDRTEPLDLGGVGVRTLSPADHVHHVALHLERFGTGARDVMDLHNVVWAHRDRFDSDGLRRSVERAGTHEGVFYALALANAHRPTFELEDLLAALAPRVRPSARRLAAERTRSPAVLLRSCSRQFSVIEKAVTAFNATDVFREKGPRFLAGWGAVFAPPLEDALKICAVVEPTPARVVGARLRAPVSLLGAVADEIGAPLLAGLALKSVLDLGRSLLPRRAPGDLDAYAARLGLTRSELDALEAKVQ